MCSLMLKLIIKLLFVMCKGWQSLIDHCLSLLTGNLVSFPQIHKTASITGYFLLGEQIAILSIKH